MNRFVQMGGVENDDLEEVFLLKTNPNDLGRSNGSQVSRRFHVEVI